MISMGSAALEDAVGIPVFMLAATLAFLFLAGSMPRTEGSRRVVRGVVAGFAACTLLAEAGAIGFGWLPPWREVGVLAPPASLAERVGVALVIAMILGVWALANGVGLGATDSRWKLDGRRVSLLVVAGLLYEGGMIVLGWPPPWRIPLPSQ
jgi:hypothetical protein